MPEASIQERVTECAPGDRFDGGDQLHDPFDETVVEPVISVSECTMIVTFSPTGPSPKNWGLSLVTVSPSVMLSRVIFDAGAVFPTSTLNLDSEVEFSGRFRSAFGFNPSMEGCRFLKSWSWPTTRAGTGLADCGNIFAVAVSPVGVTAAISKRVLAGSICA